MSLIPSEKVQEIIDRANNDILGVISSMVTLTPIGKNHMGLCPFHDEKKPSFSVSEEKQIYKCFGCGKSGRAVTFVMEHKRLNFPDAIRFLANHFNIII